MSGKTLNKDEKPLFKVHFIRPHWHDINLTDYSLTANY
jgi:hypothetical protein